MLCLVPSARALRRALPRARIALVGLPSAEWVVSRFPDYFDEFLPLPGYPGLFDGGALKDLPALISAIRGQRFDLVLQLHGSGEVSNRLALELGGRHTAGFHLPAHPAPGDWFLPYPHREHEIRRCLLLLRHLGVPAAGEQLEFPIFATDREELRRFAPGLAEKSYVAIHPGARAAARRWHPERFAQVGAALARRGWRVVLTGNQSEFELNESVGRMMGTDYLNLAGPMSAGALAALIGNARLLVSNDTGVSHLASAVGTPSVIVFTAADPSRWAPLDTRLHRTLAAPVGCRPCEYDVCPIGHLCATGVTAEMVLAQALQLAPEEVTRAA